MSVSAISIEDNFRFLGSNSASKNISCKQEFQVNYYLTSEIKFIYRAEDKIKI